MPGYPSIFYYKEKSSESSYQYDPPGDLNFTLMANNQPCWKSLYTTTVEPKPKTLIISDWTASTWSKEKIEKIIKELEKLLTAGFSLLLWQDGSFEALSNKESLYRLQDQRVRDKITPLLSKDIKTRAIEQRHGKTFDTVHVLDHHGLQCLLEDNPSWEERSLDSELCKKIAQSPQRRNILSILKKEKPKLTKIVQDEFSRESNRAIRQFSQEFPQVVININYRKLFLEGKDNLLEQPISLESLTFTKELLAGIETLGVDSLQDITTVPLILNNITSLQQLCLMNKDILEEHFPGELKLDSLKTLEITDATINCVTLKKFTQSKHLKCLKLNSSVINNSSQDLDLPPSIEILELSYTDIEFAELQSLVTNLQFLKELNLARYRCEITSNLNLPPHLENLNLSQAGINNNSLVNLLKDKTSLITLNLGRCQSIACFKEPFKLPALETLSLNSTKIRLTDLHLFLKETTKLKQLILDGCKELGDDSEVLEFSMLEQLQFLNLSATNISPSGLKKLLIKAFQLETLNMRGCKTIKNLSGVFNLPSLKNLSLCGTSVSLNDLQLLLATSSLKSLNLENCTNLDKWDGIIDINLHSLEDLNVSGVEMQISSLHNLLLNATSLKNLNLEQSRINDELNEEITFNLPALEILNLTEANFSLRGFQSLLSGARWLKSLNLARFELEDLNVKCSLLPLEKLEELNLQGSNPPWQMLAELFVKTPALKQLNLLSCRNLAELIKTKNLEILGISFENLWPALEKLTIDENNFSIALEFLPHALKELKLVCNNTLKTLKNKSYPFKNLETFTLEQAKISTAELQIILNSAPHLKTLTLSDCDIKELNFNDLDLSSLNVLRIKGSSLPPAVTNQLKSTYPELIIECEVKEGTYTNPHHRSEEYKDYNPPRQGFYFKNLQTLNQGMMIDKLCQYCTVKQQHTDIIPKIQNGFCYALAHYFVNGTFDSDSWNQHFEDMRLWNGTLETLGKDEDSLPSLFEKLVGYINDYQLKQQDKTTTYLGDDVIGFLKEHAGERLVLGNPWHAIGVCGDGQGNWTVYDPNYVKGAKSISSKELGTCLRESLGSLIEVNGSYPEVDPKIKNPNDFLAQGGLFELYNAANWEKILALLPEPKTLSKEAIEGIRLRNTAGKPAWFRGITQSNSKIQAYSLGLLEQFLSYNPDNGVDLLLKNLDPLVRQDCLTALLKLNENQVSQETKIEAPLGDQEKPSKDREIPKNKKRHFDEQQPKTPNKAIQLLVDNLKSKAIKDDEKLYEKLLRTWEKPTPKKTSVLEYSQQLVNHPGENLLIELDSKDSIINLQNHLLEQCVNKTKRPVFCINSPSDLAGLGLHVSIKNPNGQIDGKGHLTRDPDGPLYDFLKENTNTEPVLLIDYDSFTSDEIVLLNSLLDENRKIIGQPVPINTTIIGLINPKKPECYQGEDFYSRFSTTEVCPYTEQELTFIVPSVKILDAKPSKEEAAIIELSKGEDWRERLFGRWVIKEVERKKVEGEETSLEEVEQKKIEEEETSPPEKNKETVFIFEKGELIKALALGKPIHLQNAPWKNEEFQIFWRQAMIKREIFDEGTGEKIPIPENIISCGEGYDWPQLAQSIQFESSLSEKALALNPSKLSVYFRQYQCNNDTKTLNTLPGLIEQHKGTPNNPSYLTVNLTRPLGKHAWGGLLLACQEHHVILDCRLAPGIELPPELKQELKEYFLVENSPPKFAELPWTKEQECNPLIITSTDVSTTLSQITRGQDERHNEGQIEGQDDWQIIDISECHSSHLLTRLQGKINEDDLGLEFQEKMGALLYSLQEGKKILLHGDFSEELIDSLAETLLTPINKGQLVLVIPKKDNLNYCQSYHHEVQEAEKFTCLQAQFKCSDEELEHLKHFSQESYARLSTRLQFIRRKLGNQTLTNVPQDFSNDAWEGLESLSLGHGLEPLDLKTSVKDAEDFSKERLKEVISVLDTAPYVYLAGPTAVGKTTFVDEVLSKEYEIYRGDTEAQILEWAQNQSNQRKVLFIDEANISKRQWSEFSGLFNQPPGILIGGKYYPLTDQHKVVFAGNPLNYGGERQLPSLFRNHGNTLVFEPMPLAFIYEDILKPVFIGSDFEQNFLELMGPVEYEQKLLDIIQPILNVYHFIAEHSRDEVLISARELQMMALLTLSYIEREKTSFANYSLAAQHYAYQIGKTLLPQKEQDAFAQRFKPEQPLPRAQEIIWPEKFLPATSRKPIAELLEDLLALRDFRQSLDKKSSEQDSPPQEVNKSTRLPWGLGGLILEGEPGCGKSKMVTRFLKAYGFKKVKDFKKEHYEEKPFYKMPVGMATEDKECLLLKAFDEGAIVVIDEINSAPMMERFLNDLLMGKHPKEDGRPPKKPGFMIIGTQNPVTMAGRRKPSNALARRLITCVVPPYSRQEMVGILEEKGLAKQKAIALVTAYENNRQKAEREHLTPMPTFRNLERVAKYLIKGHEKAPVPLLPIEEELIEEVETSIEEELIEEVETSIEEELIEDEETSIEGKLIEGEEASIEGELVEDEEIPIGGELEESEISVEDNNDIIYLGNSIPTTSSANPYLVFGGSGLAGAISGALFGLAGGPVGAIVGAGIGATGGLVLPFIADLIASALIAIEQFFSKKEENPLSHNLDDVDPNLDVIDPNPGGNKVNPAFRKLSEEKSEENNVIIGQELSDEEKAQSYGDMFQPPREPSPIIMEKKEPKISSKPQ